MEISFKSLIFIKKFSAVFIAYWQRQIYIYPLVVILSLILAVVVIQSQCLFGLNKQEIIKLNLSLSREKDWIF
jgi:hypothetical protein